MERIFGKERKLKAQLHQINNQRHKIINSIQSKGGRTEAREAELLSLKKKRVFTPRPSTFESIARLMGIPVYVADQEQSYKDDGEPELMPLNNTYLKIGEKLPRQKKINMDEYIKRPSLSLDLILDWTKTL